MFIPMPVLIALAAGVILLLVLRGRASRRERQDSLMNISADPLLRYGKAAAPLPAQVEVQARALMDRGKKIEAIKLVRTATGMGLKEAKNCVERF